MDDSDLLDINELGDAGTPIANMVFAVQQPEASGLSQQIKLSALRSIAEISGGSTGWGEENIFITPKFFAANYGNTLRSGTLKIATDAKITAKIDTLSAITPSNIDKLTETQTTPERDIADSDIDTTPTEGTVTIGTLKACFEGKRVTINGSLSFTPDSSVPTVIIVIKDMKTPSYMQSGSGVATVSGVSSAPLCFFITEYTTPVSGLGSIRLDLSTIVNWVSGTTYTLGINTVYFTD